VAFELSNEAEQGEDLAMNVNVRPFRVLLVDPVYGRHTPFWSAPLALGYIAATLDGHFGKSCQVELVRDRDAILSRLRGSRYDVIAATNYVWNTRLSNRFLQMAKELQPNAVTVQGGPHFQIDEEEIAADYLRAHSAIDYYIHGKARRAWSPSWRSFSAVAAPSTRKSLASHFCAMASI
jgi:hypothetical protein